MDGIIDTASSPEVTESTTIKEPRNQKRVHFSTQNSMVQVPRSECSFPSVSTPDETVHKEQQIFSYESVYSNEYEPIGSENTSTTNHYVDMESKIGAEDRIAEKTKSPPALPPKPANLMKLRQALKASGKSYSVSTNTNASDDSGDMDDSEPDYCSILEVADAMKNVEIVAEVHKNADEMSVASEETKTDVTDESFADVPKLPNVAAIISPKKEVMNQFIAQDNYITKSPVKLVQNKQLPNILAEINKKNKLNIVNPQSRLPKMTTITEVKQSPPSPVLMCPIKIPEDKMPLQAEFDWYNLDAEYGKVHQSDILRRSDINEDDLPELEMDEKGNLIDEHDMSIEYNLDEEFVMGNLQSDVIDENESSDQQDSDEQEQQHELQMKMKQQLQRHHQQQFIQSKLPVPLPAVTVAPKTITNLKFDTLNCETPHKTFDAFLNDTGLTSKPLPRKRKIFYSAPFV